MKELGGDFGNSPFDKELKNRDHDDGGDDAGHKQKHPKKTRRGHLFIDIIREQKRQRRADQKPDKVSEERSPRSPH